MAQAARFLESEARQRLLRTGRIKPRGLMPDCSNYTYLAQVRGPDGAETFGVYKPAEGETPLDDFPEGTLGKREVAAFLVSAALGWNVVPLTIYRQDGPLGPGSLQQFVVADLREHRASVGLRLESARGSARWAAPRRAVATTPVRQAGRRRCRPAGHSSRAVLGPG